VSRSRNFALLSEAGDAKTSAINTMQTLRAGATDANIAAKREKFVVNRYPWV
jgi:hypothetical protein